MDYDTAHQCHPELVSGSQKLRRFRNKFGMTINKISPSAIRHTVSHGSFFAGSTSAPTTPPHRWEGIKPLLEITDFGPPARGGHFCENELKRNELFTFQYLPILHLSVI